MVHDLLAGYRSLCHDALRPVSRKTRPSEKGLLWVSDMS